MRLQEKLFQQTQEEIGGEFTAQQIYERRETLLKDPDAATALGGGKIEAAMIEMGQKVLQVNQTLATMNLEQLKQTKAQLQSNIIAEQMRRDKIDLSTMGGIQAFLDPKSFKGIEEAYNKSVINMKKGQDFGSQQMEGRGALQYLQTVKKIQGGKLSADDPMVQKYRQQAIGGAMSSITSKYEALARRETQEAHLVGGERGAERLEMAARWLAKAQNTGEIRRIATKQVDATLKLDNTMIGNLQKQTNWLAQIHAVLAARKADLDTKTGIARETTTLGADPKAVRRRQRLFKDSIGRKRDRMEGLDDSQKYINKVFGGIKSIIASSGKYYNQDAKKEGYFKYQNLQQIQTDVRGADPFQRDQTTGEYKKDDALQRLSRADRPSWNKEGYAVNERSPLVRQARDLIGRIQASQKLEETEGDRNGIGNQYKTISTP